MAFLYHMVPKDLIGDTLYPMDSLREISLKLHDDALKKYEDHPQRKALPQRVLKKLNVAQSKVLHFSPIHPNLMYKALCSIFPESNPSSKYFAIPIERIRGLPTIKFDMNCTGNYIFGEDEPEEMFEFVTPETYQILKEVPPEAITFCRSWQVQGKKWAPIMARIPHIMVQGPVSIRNCQIIEWKDSPS